MKISADWMKLDVNIFSHPKIRRIRRMPAGDSIFTLWIYLLCEGMKNSDNPGVVELTHGVPADIEDIVDGTKIKSDTVKLAIQAFCDLGMIIVDPENNGAMSIKNIRKHQSIDELEYKRHLNRERVKKFRDKNKIIELNNNSNDVMHYSNDCNAQSRVDKSREEKSRVDKNKKQPKSQYGDNNNVLLNIDEYNKLINDYGSDIAEKKINDLSYYISSTGKKYKSHYMTIKTWLRKEINNTKSDYEGLYQRYDIPKSEWNKYDNHIKIKYAGWTLTELETRIKLIKHDLKDVK